MSLSARTLHRLASVLGRSSAADIQAALSGGGLSVAHEIDVTAKVQAVLESSDPVSLEDPAKPALVSVTFRNHGAPGSHFSVGLYTSSGIVDAEGPLVHPAAYLTLVVLVPAGRTYTVYYGGGDEGDVAINAAFEQQLG